MSSPYEKWMRAAIAPTRQLEPTKAEIARVLAESVTRNSSHIHRWRLTWTWRSVTLAAVGLLLVAGTAAAAMGLLPIGSSIFGGGSVPGEAVKQEAPHNQDSSDGDDSAEKGNPADSDSMTGDDDAVRSRNDSTDANEKDKPSIAEEKKAGEKTVENVYASLAAAIEVGGAPDYLDVRSSVRSANDLPAFHRVCDGMSEAAQRDTIEYANSSARLADVKWTCESSIALLLRRSRQGGKADETAKGKVLGVNIEGNRATATVVFGSGPAQSVPLVKEKGAWKIGSKLAPANK